MRSSEARSSVPRKMAKLGDDMDWQESLAVLERKQQLQRSSRKNKSTVGQTGTMWDTKAFRMEAAAREHRVVEVRRPPPPATARHRSPSPPLPPPATVAAAGCHLTEAADPPAGRAVLEDAGAPKKAPSEPREGGGQAEVGHQGPAVARPKTRQEAPGACLCFVDLCAPRPSNDTC